MKPWLLLLIALPACDQVFSLDRAFDAPPDSPASPIDAVDAPFDAPPPCALPVGSVTTIEFVAGTYLDFSASEDEQLALVAGVNRLVDYTAAPLGMSVTPSGIGGTWGRVILAPEGDVAYLSDASAVIHVSRRTSGTNTWSTPEIVADLPVGLPGRPSLGEARLFVENGGMFQEFLRSGSTWSSIGPLYVSTTLGHSIGTLQYPNLTSDGRFLVYSLAGGGTFIRERRANGTFGSEADGGRMLVSGDNRFPVLVRCKRLFLVSKVSGEAQIHVFGP